MKQVIQRLVSVIDQCAARTSALPLESVALLPAHCGRFSMTCLEKLFKLCRFILILSLPTVCHFINTHCDRRKSIGFLVLPVSLKWCWLENGYSCFYRRKDEYFLFYQYCCILGEDITSTTPVVFFKYLTKSCPIIFLLQLWQSTTTGVLKSSCESNINNNTHRTLQSHSPSLCWCWKRSW